MRGKKSDPHPNPSDPPRRRANKRKGRGTYANDRPPILGTVGRESGQVRLRVAHRTDTETLSAHVHQFTQGDATVYTDEKVIVDSIASILPFVIGQQMLNGLTPTPLKAFTVRNFIRPFRGVHKKFLALHCWKSSHRRLSQNSSLARFLNMSQFCFPRSKL